MVKYPSALINVLKGSHLYIIVLRLMAVDKISKVCVVKFHLISHLLTMNTLVDITCIALLQFK